MVKGEGGGGGNNREEPGVGVGDELRLERNSLVPGVKAVFFDLNVVVSGVKVELVVGDCG